MKPNEKLLDSLWRQQLLPESPPEIMNFAELEAAIVSHVAGCDELPANVVCNDAERIQRPESYEFVADEFFEAMAQEPEYHIVCEQNPKTQDHECTLTLGGKSSSLSWDQEDSDWVDVRFIDFIREATADDAGRFIELGTGDQSYMFAYVDAETAQAFDDYQDEDASSRESFFTGQSESAKYRFADIKILSRDDFRRAYGAFKSRYMSGDDPADIASYKEGTARLLNPSSRYDDPLRLALRVHRNDIGSTEYAQLERWDHEEICPDEECFVLSMQAPEREIIFELGAKEAGMVMGDQEDDLGPFLLIAKDGRWGIYAAESFLLVAGREVMDAVTPMLGDVKENSNAALFVELLEQRYVPQLVELGFSPRTQYICGAAYSSEGPLHHSVIALQGDQEAAGDPVTVTLELFRFCPRIDRFVQQYEPDDWLKDEDDEPTAQIVGQDADDVEWTLASTEDAARIAPLLREAIVRAAQQLGEKPASLAEWIETYAARKVYMHAAAAALTCNDEEAALRYAQLAVEESRARGSGLIDRDIATLEAMGLDVQ